MPITLPGDPPPNPKHRWILPALLLLLLCGLLTPLGVIYYHNKVIEDNQNATIDALRRYAVLQREFFAREKRYAAAFDELGDPAWAQVRGLPSLNATTYHGYRFRLFTSQNKDVAGGARNFIDANGRLAHGYALMAVPSQYGVTGRLTFMISAPGDEIFYYDFGVKTDEALRGSDDYFVPKGAKSMRGG
ncbi:MAG TPA: DUF2950 family protein [Planctomycetota bacterium]|nr:DUF2950 family protein [Planctomycetota bacterium]